VIEGKGLIIFAIRKKINEVNNLVNQLAEKRNQMLSLERQLRDVKNESNVFCVLGDCHYNFFKGKNSKFDK